MMKKIIWGKYNVFYRIPEISTKNKVPELF